MMHKPLLSILVMFLLFLAPSASVTTFTYDETEKVALNISVKDPDNDPLAVSYQKPLSKGGEWQTTYGDAGVYRVNVSVSDGEFLTSEEMMIVVKRKEQAPSIRSFRPLPSSLPLSEGKSLSFSIKGSDLNKDALGYLWTLDGVEVSKGTSFAYAPGYDQAGEHRLEAHITDGFFTTIKAWDLSVHDIDLDTLVMDRILDTTLFEGELARLSLPDFSYYGLRYTLSSPLEKNLWMTDYNSSGIYKVGVHVFGNGFDAKKTVRLYVKNIDRAPTLAPIAPRLAKENQLITISLDASDPDGDKVSLVLKNASKGAKIEGKSIIWTPSFDEVKNADALTEISRRFHALSTVVVLEVSASANNLTATQKFPITIFNEDRAPKMNSIEHIALREGEMLSIPANATDPDGDPLSYSYDSDLPIGKQIGFNEQGTHMVKITVSDGFLEDSTYVRVDVLDGNRKPMISAPKKISAKEGENLSIALKTKDPDGDAVALSLLLGEEGMTISQNALKWTTPFSSAQKSYVAILSASDGQYAENASIQIMVSHTNRAPTLEAASVEKLSARRGVPIALSAGATDPDGDRLTYEWDFGLFDSYKGGSNHTRTFSTAEEKEASVTISDGKLSIEKKFIITVR